MSESFPTIVSLSPDFECARKLSRVMAVIFTIGFWLTLLTAVLSLGTPLAPIIDAGGNSTIGFNGLNISLAGLSVVQCVWVMLAFEIIILPAVFLMHHTRRVFGHFARGEVFVLPVIRHIRGAGFWLFLSYFAGIAGGILLVASGVTQHVHYDSGLWPLGIGVVTFIAAHVMEEARRIADDNAGIV